MFLLQQGIQRRIRMTLVYDTGSEIHWTRVNELVVGMSCVCKGLIPGVTSFRDSSLSLCCVCLSLCGS